MKSKSIKKADPATSPKTNKDIVIEKHPKAECVKAKGLFYIGVKSGKNMNPVHSGLAKNESDAWKKAAHEVM